jgi:hypothetical protein
MSFQVFPNAFTDEIDARAQAAERGFPFVEFTTVVPVAQADPVKRDCHIHAFDVMVFVLEGSLDFVDFETGQHHRCGPGTRVEDIGTNRHMETHNGFRSLNAYRIDPSTIEAPYARPVARPEHAFEVEKKS